MKFNFRKIASVLASTVMLSSTIALAAASSFPSPFVSSGVADVAVVYGANAAGTDMAAALDITANLNSRLLAQSTGITTTVTGGDFIRLEKANDKFNLGDKMSDLGGNLDSSDLSIVLGDGVYINQQMDEFEYEQEISLGTDLALTHFQETDLEDKAPIVGFDLSSKPLVLNYALEFKDKADGGTNWEDIADTDITMLGRNYYVVKCESVVGTGLKMTLLDSANTATIVEGETKTLSLGSTEYDVSITYISSTKVMLNVNGVETNTLGEGDTFRVGTNLYVGVKDILYDQKNSGISKVTISLGSGKIVLENGQEVKINNVVVSDSSNSILKSYITNSTTELDKIVLEWKINDKDTWMVPGMDLVLPGFETIKLSMGSFIEPTSEVTSIETDGEESVVLSTVVKDGPVDLNLMYNDGGATFLGLGEDSDNPLITKTLSGGATFGTLDFNVTDGSNYFVASWMNGDDAESYVLYADSVGGTISEPTLVIKNVADSSDSFEIDVGDDQDFGEINIKVNSANPNTDLASINVSRSGNTGSVYLDKIFTKEGLTIQLPTIAVVGTSSFNMSFIEATSDGDISLGKSFSFIMTPSSDGTSVGSNSLTELESASDDHVKVAYVTSDLATKTVRDTNDAPYPLDISYHGGESYAEVYVSEAGAALVAGGETGNKVVAVTDSEAADMAAKNLVVVGGSCINSVAADLLGGALCGPEFEAETGVGAGSFLIETMVLDNGKVATLVAGYNAQDTTNAAKYLTTKAVDISAGKKYIGTSATEATLVV